ncbi:hypothetical protein FACS1894184_09190 [Clostridia bacterium]|nr:hypothetical protein FACS1894184_09190 [Clostridia bacterium]
MIKAIRISEKTTTEEAFFSLPAVNVQQALTFLFLMKRWNRGDFFKHTLRSEKSFDRIVNNDKRKVRLGTILAYAFALDYGQMVGAYLIVLAGYKLSDVPYGYIRLMADFRHHSLPEVREYALSQNLPDVLGEDINA